MQSATNPSHANRPEDTGTQSISQTHLGNDTKTTASDSLNDSHNSTHAAPAQNDGVQDTVALEPEGKNRSISFIDVVPARNTNEATKKKVATFTFDIGLFNSPAALGDLIDDVDDVHKDGQ